jgi:uncharacterized protein (TIGR00299 family) protein
LTVNGTFPMMKNWGVFRFVGELRTTIDFFYMRVAYLDCFSGISGDMFLGALVDAGVPSRLLEDTVNALEIGARLEILKVRRGGISATKVDVYAHGEKDLPREQYWQERTRGSASSPAAHHHARSQAHDAGHAHGHEHAPVDLAEHNFGQLAQALRPDEFSEGSAHAHEHGRGLKEIREIIHRAAISDTAKQTAISIFQALGESEAKIHGTDIESVHFHEVGAVDAMVDIICAAVGAEVLAVDEIVCSPLNVGGGTVNCAHGILPVPAPATLELLRGAPVYSSGIQAELVTPTGAAIVKRLAKRFTSFPAMNVKQIGYGAGSRDFSGHPNVLRLTVGETQPEVAAGITQETIAVLEANIDDLNPQIFGYVMDRLLERGALDVFGIPVQMKKSRPGMLLTVLCRSEDASKLQEIIFAETTTLGVRERLENRQILARKWITVATRWGHVRVKIASMNGAVANYAPEYEDCRRIAMEHKVPLKTVIQEVLQAHLSSKKTLTNE